MRLWPTLLLSILLAGCVTAPPSPRQAQLDQCMARYGSWPPFGAAVYGNEVHLHWNQRADDGAGIREYRRKAADEVFACMGVERKK